jgi:hypothetical protein
MQIDIGKQWREGIALMHPFGVLKVFVPFKTSVVDKERDQLHDLWFGNMTLQKLQKMIMRDRVEKVLDIKPIDPDMAA